MLFKTKYTPQIETIDIFTDASYSTQKNSEYFGISSVVFDYSGKEYIFSALISCDKMSAETKIPVNLNIHHMEMLSIIKVLEYFIHSPYRIRIFTDSVSAIKFLEGEARKKKKNNHKYKSLKKIYTEVVSKIRKKGGDVELLWIPSHNKTVGNEIADKNAKAYQIVLNSARRKNNNNYNKMIFRHNTTILNYIKLCREQKKIV